MGNKPCNAQVLRILFEHFWLRQELQNSFVYSVQVRLNSRTLNLHLLCSDSKGDTKGKTKRDTKFRLIQFYIILSEPLSCFLFNGAANPGVWVVEIDDWQNWMLLMGTTKAMRKYLLKRLWFRLFYNIIQRKFRKRNDCCSQHNRLI